MTLSSRIDPMRENIRQSLWFLPSIGVILALAAAYVLIQLDPGTDGSSFAISADGARNVLEVVAGSALSVMTLMFSLTIVALQIASDQFSPRLLRTFLRDLGNQLVISIFLATFAYCVALFVGIRETAEGVEVVPPLAFRGVTVLALVSLAGLVYFIHHIAQSMRIDTIMRHVERDTLAAIERNYPDKVAGQEWIEPMPEIPPYAEPIPASRSGFIRTIEGGPLLRFAASQGLVVVFERSVGEHVVAGIPLGWMWRHAGGSLPDTKPLVDGVNAYVRVGVERSLKQDVAFGLRQLVDVAVKTSSEAGCDPATATDAVAHISVVLSRLSERRVTNNLLRDTDHTVRVAIPRRGFADYVSLGISEIRHYRLEETEVPRLLLDLLRTVGRLAPTEERRAAVLHQIDIVAGDALHNVQVPVDREAVELAAERARGAVEAGRRRRPTIHRELPELPFV